MAEFFASMIWLHFPVYLGYTRLIQTFRYCIANMDVMMVGFGKKKDVKIMIKGSKSQKYLTCTENGKFLAVSGTVVLFVLW